MPDMSGTDGNGQKRTAIGTVRKPLMGPLKRKIEELPKYGLVNNTKTSGKLHRPGTNCHEEGEVIRPICSQGVFGPTESVDGMSYSQDWKEVCIARRLPFAKYDLCKECFGHIQLVDDGEESRDSNRAGASRD
jgi:hypothetical protein